jgi:hypothetical protein
MLEKHGLGKQKTAHYKKEPFCLLSSAGCRRPSSFPVRPPTSDFLLTGEIPTDFVLPHAPPICSTTPPPRKIPTITGFVLPQAAAIFTDELPPDVKPPPPDPELPPLDREPPPPDLLLPAAAASLALFEYLRRHRHLTMNVKVMGRLTAPYRLGKATPKRCLKNYDFNFISSSLVYFNVSFIYLL